MTLFEEATVKGGGAPRAGAGLKPDAPMPPNRSPRATTTNASLQSLFARICEIADRPLAEAQTLPADAYTDPTFLQWEIQHVLESGWICLAHQSQIPSPGDFLNLEALGEPLIVVHGKDGVIRVLSRVCPHRAMDIMPDGFGYDGHGTADRRGATPGCGHTRLFLCPYHHWSFELDGALKGCPEMHRAEGFCRDEIGLRNFRSEIWNGFVFVNFSGDATPVADQYRELGNDLSGWKCDKMQVVIEKEWDCPFNWKVLVENFMEGYHHLGAHCKTLQLLMPARDTWTEAERAHSIRVNLPYKSNAGDNPDDVFCEIAGLPDEHKNQMAVFLGQPSFLLFTGPDRVFWYRIDPVGPDRSRLLTTCLVPPEAVHSDGFEEKLATCEQALVDFHLEDMEVCTAVQRGFGSRGYREGRLSHLEMPIWLIQRYLAARTRGTYPTLDRQPAPSQR